MTPRTPATLTENVERALNFILVNPDTVSGKRREEDSLFKRRHLTLPLTSRFKNGKNG